MFGEFGMKIASTCKKTNAFYEVFLFGL